MFRAARNAGFNDKTFPKLRDVQWSKTLVSAIDSTEKSAQLGLGLPTYYNSQRGQH